MNSVQHLKTSISLLFKHYCFKSYKRIKPIYLYLISRPFQNDISHLFYNNYMKNNTTFSYPCHQPSLFLYIQRAFLSNQAANMILSFLLVVQKMFAILELKC
jgi:hypothetical protein